MVKAAPVRRTRMSANARRHQMLDACQRVVESDGFAAATINRVADESGVTRTVVYQQFGGGPQMLVALIDRAVSNTAGQFLNAAVDSQGETRSFTDAFDHLLAAIDTTPAAWRLLMLPPEGGPPELHRKLAESRELVRLYVAGLAHTAGDPDPDLTARALHAIAEEFVRLRLVDPQAYSRERLLAEARRVAGAFGSC